MKKKAPMAPKNRRRKISVPPRPRATPASKEKNRLHPKAKIPARPGGKRTPYLENDLFRCLMDNTTDRIYFKDKESRFLLNNRAQAVLFGLHDPSEAIGKTDFNFFTEEHARQAYADEQRIISSGKPIVDLEEKVTWPDGRETWVSSTKFPLRDREGRIVGTFGISRDITERKAVGSSILQVDQELGKTNAALQSEINDRRRAEEALAHERDLFRTMMDNTTDRIYFKDQESRFILINRSQADHFDLRDPSESNGKTDFDYFTEEHARQAYTDERQIMDSGKPLVDLEEKETWPDGRETWVTSTKFPMRDRNGRIIGTFGISRDITERKTMEISIQLANEKLAVMVNWLEGRNRDISVLNDMGKRLEECRSKEEAYPIIASQMEKLIPVHTGMLYLAGEDRRRMEAVTHWGKAPDPADSFAVEECRAAREGWIDVVNTIQVGSHCAHLTLVSGEKLSSLCIPLISQGETIGVLHLRGRHEEGTGALPDLKRDLAVMAVDHIALALANITLRESLRVQSIRDSLTGLFNRRYLEESLARELARARRKGTGLGVIMLDVDRLKQVNDTLGHEAGDALLQVVGQWLQSNIRAEDISCRYGGDEFVLILPDASLEATVQRAQQICEGVRILKIEYRDAPLSSATVSIGVAGFPTHGETRDELLAAVDAALYKAKEQGRNRVLVASGAPSSTPKNG